MYRPLLYLRLTYIFLPNLSVLDIKCSCIGISKYSYNHFVFMDVFMEFIIKVVVIFHA